MRPSQNDNPKSKELVPLSKSSQYTFSPFLVNSLKIPSSPGFFYGSASYSQNHNFIIACPSDNTVQFYDATTLEPLKGRENIKLDDQVKGISYQPKTEVYILKCMPGLIYSYNANSHVMNQLTKDKKAYVLAAEFVSPSCYAFSVFRSKFLQIGNLENGEVLKFSSQNMDSLYLHHLCNSPLLLSSIENGSILIYRTDKLPHLPIIGRFQKEGNRGSVVLTQSFMMNGKELVATIAKEKTIKIWCVPKGKMRLVKAIQTLKKIQSFVYLENYKTIAIVYKYDFVEFWGVLSGRLERMLTLGILDGQSVFLMKEKNMIGVKGFNESEIEFVQLHPLEEKKAR